MTKKTNKVKTPETEGDFSLLNEVKRLMRTKHFGPYLNIHEAAEYTRFSASTLRNRVRDGRLKRLRSGRRIIFEREELDRMLHEEK